MAQTIIRRYSKNFKKYDEIALADNLFLTAYERWQGCGVGIDIIKGMLPADKTEALEICNNGIEIDNIKYIAYTSTPSMQKKEEDGEKCEMFFIKEDKKEFIDYFEDLISLGTIKQFENKEICINKKVTSRIALAMSATTKIDFIPRIAVVPNKEIELIEDIIYYTSENSKLIEHKEDNKPIKTTLHDGFGLMNQSCADAIKSSLNLNYDVDFAVIRLYGLAVKGLCLRFDWVDYLENHCDNQFIVKDIWNNEVDLRTVDLILTESQAKWWENFEDIDDYYSKLNGCADKDLANCLYVTKVNKKKTKEYSLTNYQLISNLKLDLDDLIELSKPTAKLYKDIINGDLASIKYFLKEFENEDGEYCPQQKVDYLLNAHDDFIKSSVVKSTISNAILKSIALLSSGKFYVKGNYKLMIPNPFLLIDNLLNIDSVTLNKNEFYIPKNSNKKLTISRNPLASPWEIKNIETVSNELFDKYFGKYTDEIVFFNNIDYSHCTLSNADYDGDGVLCVENEIIYDNVISDERKFLHITEGEQKKLIYNEENKFKALIESSGNWIGSLSINGAKISNKCLYGTKEDIVNAFYGNRDKLLYLTELEQQVIDAPKTLVLPSKAEFTVLDITQPKPLFLKYKDGYYKEHKTNEDDLSHYEQFAKLIIDGLLMPCVESKKEGSDILTKYIYSKNVAVDDNCLNDIINFKNAVATENKKLKMNEKRYKENYKEAYTLMVTKYQLLSNKIRSKYSHRQICNCLTKIPRITDKFIINYFWYELVVKLNELDLTAKVLSRCKDGEYEFFGHKYKLVESKLIEDNLQEKEIEKKMKRKGKQGIISIGKCDFEQLKGDCKVKIDTASIDLLKDNEKVTYAFKDIKDTDNKSTNDNLYECSTIDIVEIYKETDKTYKVLINY